MPTDANRCQPDVPDMVVSINEGKAKPSRPLLQEEKTLLDRAIAVIIAGDAQKDISFTWSEWRNPGWNIIHSAELFRARVGWPHRVRVNTNSFWVDIRLGPEPELIPLEVCYPLSRNPKSVISGVLHYFSHRHLIECRKCGWNPMRPGPCLDIKRHGSKCPSCKSDLTVLSSSAKAGQ